MNKGCTKQPYVGKTSSFDGYDTPYSHQLASKDTAQLILSHMLCQSRMV